MSSATNILHSDGGVKDPSVEKLIQVYLYARWFTVHVFMLSYTNIFIVCIELLDLDNQYERIHVYLVVPV